MLTRHQATLIGSLSILLWGSLALLTRLTAGVFPPFQLLAMTFALAFGLMLAKWLRAGQSPLGFLRQPPLAWALGVGGLFGYHFCYFLAMRLAPVVQVSLLAYLWPLLILLFSALLPGHRLSRWHLLGGLLALGVLSYAAPLISTLLLLGAGLATPSWSLLLSCLAIIGGAGLAARAG